MRHGRSAGRVGTASWLVTVAIVLAACLHHAARSAEPPDGPGAVATSGTEELEARIPFEGLGLDGFDGVGSIASELRRMQAESLANEAALLADEAWAVGMAVTGPGGSARAAGSKLAGDATAPAPLKAMLESTVSGVDVSAGLDADPGTIQSGAARWIGGVKVATEGNLGRAELAVRTSVRYAEASRLIGLELGPRFERVFPSGLTFFVDGKAEAETAASPEQRVWTPSASNFDGFGSLGVVGRTGIVR